MEDGNDVVELMREGHTHIALETCEEVVDETYNETATLNSVMMLPR